MKINSIIKIIAAVLTLALVVSGCAEETESPVIQPTPSPTPAPTATAVAPQYGGTLNLSMRLPKTLNPLLNEDSTVDAILKLIFLPLAVLDETAKPVPNSAFVQDITFAADGMSAVISLKSGMRWSDDTEITANDVAFTVNTLRNAPETVIYKENVRNMLSPEVLDAYTIQLNFMQPVAATRYALRFPIIPAHYYNNAAATIPDSDINMNPVGNGPYTFVGYQPVESVRLQASEKALTAKPYIGAVNVLITSDRATDFYAFDQGMVDVVYGEIADRGKYLGSNAYTVTEYVATDYDFIGFNFNNPLFQDKAVREAVAYATPHERILSEAYVHYAVPATSPVSPVSWLYEPDVKTWAFDTAAAEETLSGAGWTRNAATGTWVKAPATADDIAGEPLSTAFVILVNEENEERVIIAEMLSESLNSIGFATTVEAVDFDTYQQRVTDRDYDLVIGGYHLSIVPDFSFLLKSTNAEFGANILDYRDAETDALLEQAVGGRTDAGYKKAMSDLQKRIAEELPVISLAFRESAIIMNKKIHGDIKPVLDNLYANIGEWFIN